jgi:hypothetical protein
MTLIRAGLVFTALGLTACVGGESGDGMTDEGEGANNACSVGSEGCPCTGGGSCDSGLSCLSGVCVDTGTGPGSSPTPINPGGPAPNNPAVENPPSMPAGTPSDAVSTLNAGIILPNEGQPLMNPELDATVILTPDQSAMQVQPLMAGSMVSVNIPFSATGGNVVAAGIRFGDSGPIRTVNIPQAQGQSNAALAFDFQIPASVCNDLANICHDIRCYEFAVTDAGRVSRENIQDIALMCGNCCEPTCQDLLPPGSCSTECLTDADCDEGVTCSMGLCVGEGALHFTLTWSAATDLDLHVMTPTSSELYFGNSMVDSGELDRDNTSGGAGSVENVFFTDPPVGEFSYWVVNYNGREAASFTLQAFKNGALVATQSETLPAQGGLASSMFTIAWP